MTMILEIAKTRPAQHSQMNIAVTITSYFGSGGFKRGEPGGPVLPPPSPFGFFFKFTKSLQAKNWYLDEYEICLKMLEMTSLVRHKFSKISAVCVCVCGGGGGGGGGG